MKKKMLQKFTFIAFSLVLTTVSAFAQRGTITGHIKDKVTGEDIIGASVFLEGTTTGSATDIQGNFQFTAEAGTYNLVVTYVGYQKLVVNAIAVKAGEELKLPLQLEGDNQQLEEVVVKAQADKTSESVLLMERKKSIEIVQSIGALELSRKGVGDAESAVTQVTGITKQQGVKNVFVRGLGDRYNSTTLNGLPLPSEDPAYKNIALSFFSTDIIDNIDVNKTFSSNFYADVAGANINIVSKKLFDDKELSVSGSLGGNSLVLGAQNFYTLDESNYFGTVDKNVPVNDLTKFTFKNSYNNKTVSTPINSNFSIKGGRRFNVGDNTLEFFAVASSVSEYTYKEGITRQTNTVGQYRQDLKYKRYEYNPSQFGLGNLTYRFGNGNSLSYNTIYIHDSKQYFAEYSGFSINGVDDITQSNAYDMLIRRQQVNNNSLQVNQLLGQFELSDKLTLDVRSSYNIVKGSEPDRRQQWYIGDGNGENYIANNSSPAFNHRFFSTLKENEISGVITASYKLNKENSKIDVGYNTRITDRNFDYTQFNFANPTTATVDAENPDNYFNQQNLDNGTIQMETSRGKISNPLALTPFYYTGKRSIHSGFVNLAYQFTPNFSMVVGTRFEKFHQEVVWSVGADERRENIAGDNTVTRDKTYILPSLNLKYSLSENDQVRLSASETYTFPQFKEAAPFLYEDITYNIFGNPNVEPIENWNFDLKYEHYFSVDELIAVTGFYKTVKGTLNAILANSAALEYSYFNTGNADLAGVELEFRKRLFDMAKPSGEAYFTYGLNLSYLYQTQTLQSKSFSSGATFTPTNSTSALEGAAPLLINSDLTFNRVNSNGIKMTSAVVFNYFSKRVLAIGAQQQQNVMERGIATLDFISKVGISQRLSMSLAFKNLLNPEYRLMKEVISTGKDDILQSYRLGITSSIGFSYKF